MQVWPLNTIYPLSVEDVFGDKDVSGEVIGGGNVWVTVTGLSVPVLWAPGLVAEPGNIFAWEKSQMISQSLKKKIGNQLVVEHS